MGTVGGREASAREADGGKGKGEGPGPQEAWSAARWLFHDRSQESIPGVRRVKLRYGPYRVPNMNKSSITGEMGMLWNYPDVKIEKPCSTTCVLIRQWAGLEFPDGRNANIDNGMWLHHMVALLIGPNRWDPTCYGKGMSLPHFDVNSTPVCFRALLLVRKRAHAACELGH